VTKGEDLRLQGGTGSKTGRYQSEKGDKKRAHRGSHHDLTNDRNLCVFRSDRVFGKHRYLIKNSAHKELLQTIRTVHAGKKALSPEASQEVASHATDDTLTPAEVAVLRLIADGSANKQIADQLSISEETVKSRVKNILSKLGANDRTHAAMLGIKRGIIEL